jgi:iron complex outermembrane receptor protein
VEAGRVGVRWRIDELELLAHAGRYGRAPTLGEQRGISATVRGNPTLRPERGLLVDGGLRHGGIVAGIPVALEVFAFAQWISELILYQRSSLGFLRPYNAGATRTLGLEVAARAAPWRWLLVELALTALDPRDTSTTRLGSNDLLPFRSRLQAAPALVIRPGGWARWGLDETTLEARYLHQSSRYADGSGQVVLPAQGSLDLEVSALWWQRRLGLRGRAANVLDQVRSDVIGFPLPGRSFFFSLELSWP